MRGVKLCIMICATAYSLFTRVLHWHKHYTFLLAAAPYPEGGGEEETEQQQKEAFFLKLPLWEMLVCWLFRLCQDDYWKNEKEGKKRRWSWPPLGCHWGKRSSTSSSSLMDDVLMCTVVWTLPQKVPLVLLILPPFSKWPIIDLISFD